jgi:hypothetical protein
MVGEKLDRDKLNHTMIYDKLFNSVQCTIVNYIEDKISGDLDLKVNKKKKKSLIQIFEDYAPTEVVCENCENNWSSIEW